MSIVSSRITVTTAATQIAVNDSVDNDPYFQRYLLRNAGVNDVFLGTSTVTTSTGFALPTTESISVTLRRGDSIHGIVAAATEPVHVLKDS